jgi:hypothetical protein
MGRNLTGLTRDEKAQASLFDAMMFFTVMLVASMLVTVFSSQTQQTQEVISREDMMRYTEETREALLQSTMFETWYYDIHGNKVMKPPGSANINELLLEELALLDDGLSKQNFEEGYESDIKRTMDGLIGAGYGYAIEAIYANVSSGITYEILISNTDSENDVANRDVTTSQWSSSMENLGKSGDATIKLSIWRI